MLISEFAATVGGAMHNLADDFEITAATSFDVADETAVCVVASAKLNKEATASRAGAFIVAPDNILPERTCIAVPEPWPAMVALLNELHPPQTQYWFEGISDAAFVHPTAVLGAGVAIGPNSVVGPGSRLGDNCIICPGAVIGTNVTIGAGSIIEPCAVIEANTQLGNRCIIHANSVIGSDGFKFEITSKGRIKIPQVGNVVLGDDCEIGACTCIDRAGFTTTRLGARTKIDNLVQIGHNCVTGHDVVIVSQAGVAGSCKIGNWAILAAKSGMTDHVTMGDGAILLAGAGIMRDLAPGEHVFGGGIARPVRQAMKIHAAQEKLPDMLKEVKALQRKVAELERKLNEAEA